MTATAFTEPFRDYPSRPGSALWTGPTSNFNAPAAFPGKDGRPRIVILSASVGSGHIRAAQAIKGALTQRLPQATVSHIDVLSLTNRVFRSAYAAGYFRAVARTPNLVGMLYDMLDQPGNFGAAGKARLAFERFNFSRLVRLLAEQPWDLAISTHFLPPELIAMLRRRGRIAIPHVTVVTDFDVHGMWVNEPCDRYFVATNEARNNIAGWGVDHDRIEVTGIPIDPAFTRPMDRLACQRRHGLSPDRPVVLQLAGGFGVGSIERTYRAICQSERAMQVIVVTGQNMQARQRLEAINPPRRHTARILGYTSEMHELMRAADVVVSKPGGLTTSECLASGCAMVVAEPIPGQEDRNSDFLLENGCAIKVNNLSSLSYKLASLLNDPDRLSRMRRAARLCSRPDAAFDIAGRCIQFLESRAALQLSGSAYLDTF